jgi:hypothetical protein
MMEERSPRPGVVRRVSRRSKRVRVNNLHLPPYPSEESLPRYDRWYIAHPYLSTVIIVISAICLSFGYRLYLGKPLLDALSGTFPMGLSIAISSLIIARYWHRLYRRPYRQDD